MQGTGFFVLSLPWPVSSTSVLWRYTSNDGLVEVFATPFGRVVIQLSDRAGVFRWKSQQIWLDGLFVGIFVVTWDGEDVRLRVNGVEILSLADAVGNVADMSGTQIAAAPLPQPAIQDLKHLHSKNHDEEFFLRTLEDVQDKAQSSHRYDLIRAAGLLRQLLCDAEPLIHRVNRAHRVPLTFTTLTDPGPPPGPQANLIMQGIDPSSWPTSPKATRNLSGFLRMPCLIGEANTACISDVVLACANLMGGVHFGSQKNADERFVLWVDEAISVGDATVVLGAIRGICRVTLNALEPLARAVAR